MFDDLLDEQQRHAEAKRWRKALLVNDKLIELDSSKEYLFRERSRYYRRLNDLDGAEEAMSTYLALKCGTGIENLKEKLNASLRKSLNIDALYTSYSVTSSGGLNFGMMEHIASDGSMLFTKITYRKVGEAEKKLYEKVRARVPPIEACTLPLVHYLDIKAGDLSLLTFPKISGEHASLGRDTQKIFELYSSLSEIRYRDMKSFLKKRTPPRVTVNRELKLSRVFSHLHDDDLLKEVFSWIKNRLGKVAASNKIVSDFSELENTLVSGEFFKKLKKKCGYRLMHGDFHQGNLLLSENKEKIYLIDWPNMYVAPKGVDMTKIFRRENWNFERIRQEFLDRQDANGDMERLEKGVFVFAMVLTWLNFAPKKTTQNYEDYIGPALQYMNNELLIS